MQEATNKWEELARTRCQDEKKLEALKEATERIRTIINDDVPKLGEVFEEKLGRRDGELADQYSRRRVDTLISAAFTLYSNTTPDGKNTAAFVEYAQSIANTVMVAMDLEMPPPTHARLEKVSEAINRELVFGENYAVVLFGPSDVVYKTSVKGSLGIDLFELGAMAARAQHEESRRKEMHAAIGGILDRIAAKAKVAQKPDGEPTPAHAPTATDAP